MIILQIKKIDYYMLGVLIMNKELRDAFKVNGISTVENEYNLKKNTKKIVNLVRKINSRVGF